MEAPPKLWTEAVHEIAFNAEGIRRMAIDGDAAALWAEAVHAIAQMPSWRRDGQMLLWFVTGNSWVNNRSTKKSSTGQGALASLRGI